jgi:hypothetical protein
MCSDASKFPWACIMEIYMMVVCDTVPVHLWTNMCPLQVDNQWETIPPMSNVVNQWGLLGSFRDVEMTSSCITKAHPIMVTAPTNWESGAHCMSCRQLDGLELSLLGSLAGLCLFQTAWITWKWLSAALTACIYLVEDDSLSVSGTSWNFWVLCFLSLPWAGCFPVGWTASP